MKVYEYDECYCIGILFNTTFIKCAVHSSDYSCILFLGERRDYTMYLPPALGRILKDEGTWLEQVDMIEHLIEILSYIYTNKIDTERDNVALKRR